MPQFQELSATTRSCEVCGAALSERGQLCPQCGVPIARETVPAVPERRSAPTATKQGVRRINVPDWDGLLALGIVLFVVGALLISSTGIRLTPNGTSTQDRPDTHVPFADGSSATVTTASDITLRITIDRIIDPATPTRRIQRPIARNRFVAVELTAENIGTAEARSGDFLLRTRDGFEYRPTPVSMDGARPNWRSQTLTSGGKIQGVVAFEVQADAPIEWLKFDANSFAKGDVYFGAQ